MTGNTGDGRAGWGEILNRHYGPSVALVCLGVWLHAADSLLVATMMPAIVAEIGGAALVGWSVALYEIGTILTGAASGLLAARHGVRLPMGVAALLFAAGCAISATAPAMWLLLAGRLVQGVGGGGLMALSFVATGMLFPNRLIPRAMATVSTVWGMSGFLGPLVGGLFVEYATWRTGFWVFALQALALAAWITLGLKVPDGPAREKAGAWAPHIVLLGLGVILIAYGGVAVAPLRTAAFVLAGIVFLIGFVVLDGRREGSRLLPRQPFSLATPAGSALIMILCLAIATIALTVYGPLLVVRLHGASALTAGYIVACSTIGWTVAAILVSGAPQRHDLKWIAAGMLLASASILGFLYSVPRGPLWLIAVFAATEGAGFGLAWAFILRQTTALAPARDVERVAGSIPTVQRLGYALGAAYAGIVANAAGFAEAADLEETAQVARVIFASCLPFAAVGLVAMGRFVYLGARGRAARATG